MPLARLGGFREYTRVDDAMKKFLSELRGINLGSEVIDFRDALGRVLSQDIASKVDMPTYDKAAMDGYALRARDTFGASSTNPMTLAVIGEATIEKVHEMRVGSGEAVRVATGAQMPRDADSVVMVEYTRSAGHMNVDILRALSPAENVSKVGEDVNRGETVLKKGTKIRPHDIGILSALGHFRLQVLKSPRVAILSTGNELIQPGEELSLGMVFNVNGPAIAAMVKEWGGHPIDLGIAGDNKKEIRKKMEDGLSKADALVVSAGSSVGKKDLVPEIVGSLGEPGVLVHGLAMRPSSPTGLAVVRGKPVIMLPGYPLSSMLAFYVFGKAMINNLLRTKGDPEPTLRATMSRRVASSGGMRTYVRVKLRKEGGKNVAEPIRTSGASILSSLITADGIIVIPEEQEGLEAGEESEVLLLRPVNAN